MDASRLPPELQLVVLFGSRARGEAAANSDWDLGVTFKPGNDQNPLRDCALDLPLAQALGINSDAVHVVDLRRSSPLLQRNAARDGQPLYEAAAGAFADYCSLALRQWDDWQQRQQRLNRDLQR